MSLKYTRASLGVAIALLMAACSDSAHPVGRASGETPQPLSIGDLADSKGTEAETKVDADGAPAQLRTPTKSTDAVVSTAGFNAARAADLLDSKDFGQRVRQIAAEGGRVPGAADATLSVQKSLASLAAAIDPEASVGPAACNGDVCVASVQSKMDKAQWDTWRAELAKMPEPKRSATMYSPVRMPDGSKVYRMLMVTKSGSSGIDIPFHSIPTVDQARRRGLIPPKG
jgi:hypothetical protein